MRHILHVKNRKGPNMTDLTKTLKTYKTASGVAKAVYKIIQKECRDYGLNPQIETALMSPEESQRRGYGFNWSIAWESGPYDWTIVQAGKQSYDGAFYFEPYNSFVLTIAKS